MSILGTMLGQVVVTGTPQSLASGSLGQQTLVSSIMLANTTRRVHKVRMFFDPSGLVFDSTTAIVWDLKVRPGQFKDLHFAITFDSQSNVIKVSGSGGVTATAFGALRSV